MLGSVTPPTQVEAAAKGRQALAEVLAKGRCLQAAQQHDSSRVLVEPLPQGQCLPADREHDTCQAFMVER